VDLGERRGLVATHSSGEHSRSAVEAKE